jgi:mediator of RNA polymerase II transcription subunit 17
MLAINLPSKSCHSLVFGFLSGHSNVPKKSNKIKTHGSLKNPSKKPEKESLSDNECVKDTHLLLRKVHRTIFDEQVASLFLSF